MFKISESESKNAETERKFKEMRGRMRLAGHTWKKNAFKRQIVRKLLLQINNQNNLPISLRDKFYRVTIIYDYQNLELNKVTIFVSTSKKLSL